MFNEIKVAISSLFKRGENSGSKKPILKKIVTSKQFNQNTALATYLIANNIIKAEQFNIFVTAAPFCYMSYEVEKRNKTGLRLIAQPSKDLKLVQRYCIDLLRKDFPIHSKALAYEQGTSIKKNAQLHQTNSYLLKMDFKDFFPSITPVFFKKVIEQHGINMSEDEFIILTRLLFWRPKGKPFQLSIGAPSSPFVSNVVMYFFDKALDEECVKRGIVYSRYADDLTFSTSHKSILFSIPALVDQFIKQYCFGYLSINQAKTVFSSKKFNRHITGITLTNANKLSLGRAKKRYIKSLVFQFKQKALSEEQIEQLQGYLGYAKFIEPTFLESLKSKFGYLILDDIFKAR